MHKTCLCKPDYHEEIKYLWLVAHEGSLPGHWPTWYCILDFLKTFPFHNTFFFPAVLIIFCFFKSYWFSFGHIYPSFFNSRIEKYGWLQYLMAVALFPRKSPNLFHPLKHENSPKKFIFCDSIPSLLIALIFQFWKKVNHTPDNLNFIVLLKMSAICQERKRNSLKTRN